MQKHVVKRQLIELSVSDQGQAQQLQAEVSRIYRQRIVPLLDQLCTELSSPDRIHRIERLEVDLGHIDPDQLERELVKRTYEALEQTLAQEIDLQERGEAGVEQGPQVRSQLELLVFFLRTGSLPWWVDANQPHLLDDTLQFLVDSAPETLRQAIAKLNQSDPMLRRLIHTFNDELLARVALVLSSRPDDIMAMDLEAFVTLVIQAAPIPADRLRQQLWLRIVPLISLTATQVTKPVSFYHTILGQLALQFGVPYPTLLTDLERSMDTSAPLPESLRRSLQNLLNQETVSSSTSVPNTALSTAALTDFISTLRAFANRLPAPARKQLLAELNTLEAQSIPDSSLSETLVRIAELISETGEYQQPLTAEEQTLPADRDAAELASGILISVQALSQALEKEAVALDLTFSESDEVYVHNGGLVILWPFLERFFGNLDLLAERRFKDEAARHRAVGILQHLVYPGEPFPEYLLPLNKILCGLDLANVFSFGPSLTDTELQHCTLFLEAVIGQAPILKNMSADGFRGTFLLRPAILSSRDGAWLLRVEHKTYDLVLDRFPWSWQWVKLPWMEIPLRVEW